MPTDTKEQGKVILKLLVKAHSDAPTTYLNHNNAFEMLISTLLSAHTTDASVNKVTPELFSKYPGPREMAKAEIDDLIPIIRTVGTYNRKSEYIKKASEILVERYNGEVPKTIDELIVLPGVSRKTSNVVLSVVFGINEGVVVDTHIGRVTQRLGLTEQTKPDKIEKDLMEMLPRDKWYEYARLAGAHGRRICDAKKPKCAVCTLNHLCPSAVL
ncbi:MAG: endonuclease III [Candidatus Thorarchaeota archaeon]|nr:endonuclease III [Candidatus Thorarchaeota archaeon]